ncbi:MAG: nicotinic acid mononucleotide adenylyltransferase [Rhodobacterales bacterium]|nr:MAG: nicotinic acid mononucleotide adenylyltransferase [Rhodobacterales bacterium]
MRHEMPYARPGQVVGLLGGSFDPAHSGHVHITREALKRFRLDRVWWLVSPGNPLKANPPAPLPERMARARRVMRHPRVEITDLEARFGTRYTAETLAQLHRAYPGVRFVWLMGADNLSQFHRWEDWRAIADNVPIGVLARPGKRVAARLSKAARVYRAAKLAGEDAGLLATRPAPVWCMTNLPMRAVSSSAIRAAGEW